jgi:bifunctional UDP-N-acetylglucosamine pyrophosphorylase/glucosamine-1-phosphate N-acetyltransferase
MPLTIIILAAGEGKRMKSELPKVLHLCGEKPMLVRVVEAARKLEPNKLVIVTGRHHKTIIQTLGIWIDVFGISFVEQPQPIGTGHAVNCCKQQFEANDRVLILNGDMPLIQSQLLENFVNELSLVDGLVLTARLENPHGYGRIIYDKNEFTQIIEEKDCTEEQRKINEINSGVYVFRGKVLHRCLPLITNENKQKEYYLTDIVGLAKEYNISTFLIKDDENFQIRGANTPEELSELSLLTTLDEKK